MKLNILALGLATVETIALGPVLDPDSVLHSHPEQTASCVENQFTIICKESGNLRKSKSGWNPIRFREGDR